MLNFAVLDLMSRGASRKEGLCFGYPQRRASNPTYQDSRRGTVTAAWRPELARAERVGLVDRPLERFNDIARSTSSLANSGEAAYRLSVLRESSRACLA